MKYFEETHLNELVCFLATTIKRKTKTKKADHFQSVRFKIISVCSLPEICFFLFSVSHIPKTASCSHSSCKLNKTV